MSHSSVEGSRPERYIQNLGSARVMFSESGPVPKISVIFRPGFLFGAGIFGLVAGGGEKKTSFSDGESPIVIDLVVSVFFDCVCDVLLSRLVTSVLRLLTFSSRASTLFSRGL
jgi:hypothetical protein